MGEKLKQQSYEDNNEEPLDLSHPEFWEEVGGVWQLKKEVFERQNEILLNNLHSDFGIEAGPWRFNREKSFFEKMPTMKLRVGFDDVKLLDDCPFVAKIGINKDELVAGKYVGFFYGNVKVKDDLIKWAKKFPYSELIEGLDKNSISLPDSKVSVINKVEKDN